MKKEMWKDLAKSTIVSIGMAMTIFCLVGVGFDLACHGDFHMQGYGFTKMVLGSLVVGLGFGLPTVVYQKESLPLPVRAMIHMGIGCLIYTIVAYAEGWLGTYRGIGFAALMVALQLAVAFGIWYLFMRHYRKEARKLNDRLQEMK